MSGATRQPRYFSELTSECVNSDVAGKTLVLPIGSIEQHGPHLPLSVDILLAEAFGNAVASSIDAYMLPTLPIGVRSLPQSGGGLSFPGTVYAKGETFTRFLKESIASLTHLPFARLIISNGHYENEAFIFEALDELREAGLLNGREIIAFSWWSFVDQDWVARNIPEFPGWHAEHAGVSETSLLLALHPKLVRPARPDNPMPPQAGIYRHPTDPNATSSQGVLSVTSTASAELGRSLYKHVIEQFAHYMKKTGYHTS